MSVSKVTEKKSFFGEFKLEEGQTVVHELEKMRLWLRRELNEIWVARQSGTTNNKTSEPDASEWTRYVLPDKIDTFELQPTTPDRPIIVRPLHSFKVFPGGEATVYTSIPVWVVLRTVQKKANKITEFPLFNLSETWFGDPTEGELCYAAVTRALRNFQPDLVKPYRITCQLDVKNQSDEELQVEKFCFRVGHLSIFQKDDRLWADVTRIQFDGSDKHSNIIMTGRCPKIANGAKLVAGPRDPQKKGIRSKTFQLIKDFGLSVG